MPHRQLGSEAFHGLRYLRAILKGEPTDLTQRVKLYDVIGRGRPKQLKRPLRYGDAIFLDYDTS